MSKSLVAVGLIAIALGQTPASAQTSASARAGVLATVQQFLDGFNKGDTKTAAAACADQTSVIDEFPPHEWHGAGACGRWMNDYDADAKKNGITDGVVQLGTPSHVEITGDRAYAVYPADYSYKRRGVPEKEVGSVIVLSLQNGTSGWRITGWAWAKH